MATSEARIAVWTIITGKGMTNAFWENRGHRTPCHRVLGSARVRPSAWRSARWRSGVRPRAVTRLESPRGPESAGAGGVQHLSRDGPATLEGYVDDPTATAGCAPESERVGYHGAPNGPAASRKPPGRPPASACHAGRGTPGCAHASAVDAGASDHPATADAQDGEASAPDATGSAVAEDSRCVVA